MSDPTKRLLNGRLDTLVLKTLEVLFVERT